MFDKITIVFGLRVDKCIGFVVETDTYSITCDGASCGGSHFNLEERIQDIVDTLLS